MTDSGREQIRDRWHRLENALTELRKQCEHPNIIKRVHAETMFPILPDMICIDCGEFVFSHDPDVEVQDSKEKAMSFGRGPFIQTRSGFCFYPFDPRPEEVHISDLAAHLSKICRFGGACLSFYSVAEHSVRLSHLVSPQNALPALLHDGHEAYTNDLHLPIKRELPEYRAICQKVHFAVFQRFGLDPDYADEIRELDEVLLYTEKRDLMAPCERAWQKEDVVAPLEEKLNFTTTWLPEEAAQKFLKRFWELYSVPVV